MQKTGFWQCMRNGGFCYQRPISTDHTGHIQPLTRISQHYGSLSWESSASLLESVALEVSSFYRGFLTPWAPVQQDIRLEMEPGPRVLASTTYCIWGFPKLGLPPRPPIMQNQMENDMETVIIWWLLGFGTRVTFLGVLVIRNMIFGGLFWGPAT